MERRPYHSVTRDAWPVIRGCAICLGRRGEMRTAMERRPYRRKRQECRFPEWPRRSAALPLWSQQVATLLWEQLSRANREAIQPLCNSAVFSRQFIVLSIESSPSVSASRKPVMSPSYPHSAAFAALALCNPYSEVPPPARTRGAGAQSHSSGTGHLLLSWKPDRLRQDV